MCMKYEGIDEQFADRLVVYSENLCNAHLILSRDECISSGARRRMPRLLQRTPKHSSATAAEEYVVTIYYLSAAVTKVPKPCPKRSTPKTQNSTQQHIPIKHTNSRCRHHLQIPPPHFRGVSRHLVLAHYKSLFPVCMIDSQSLRPSKPSTSMHAGCCRPGK